jgi:L-lysine 2,3-aminomutase
MLAKLFQESSCKPSLYTNNAKFTICLPSQLWSIKPQYLIFNPDSYSSVTKIIIQIIQVYSMQNKTNSCLAGNLSWLYYFNISINNSKVHHKWWRMNNNGWSNSRTTAGRSKAVSYISKSANENTFTQYVESMNTAKKFRNTVDKLPV